LATGDSASRGGISAKAVTNEEDDLAHFFRQVDQQGERSRSARATRNGTTTRATDLEGTHMHRMWRMVPGGVHDIIEGDGTTRTVFTVEGLQPPTIYNGSYVSDPTGALDALTVSYLNRNLTWVDRLTPFRVLCVVLPRLPRELSARRQYALQILRSWYGGTRMYERSTLVVLARDGLVEIVVGKQARLVFSDAVAHHFANRAMEMLGHHNTTKFAPSPALLQETCQKLVFYIAFTVRSRTQATAVSMRSMSMFMMIFMMMTIAATKQQQARRYAEIYGYADDPYGRHPTWLFARNEFWDEFEHGRRGGTVDHFMIERAEQERAFFRLQLLSMILSQRAHQDDDDDDDDEYGDEDDTVEEEFRPMISYQA